MSKIIGFHHPSVKPCGLEAQEKAIHFYRDVLELPVISDSLAPDGHHRIMLDAGNGVCIELSMSNEPVPEQAGVVNHIALSVENLDEIVELVLANGASLIKISQKPSTTGLFRRNAFVTAPSGEMIELVELV